MCWRSEWEKENRRVIYPIALGVIVAGIVAMFMLWVFTGRH